jgi:hypothetical protein
MRTAMIVCCMLLGAWVSAAAQVSISINMQVYPDLVPVPGYPVYYAPQVDSNYFFYDGFYWVYTDDGWYSSAWYNGPWDSVTPEFVPLFVLRVPVRYYRRPPAYFRNWASEAPPRWGEHWGPVWQQRRAGWDRWDRASVPAPAPLPTYQRQYSGDRYPRPSQQQTLLNQNYHYQPREPVVRQQQQQPPTLAPPPQRPARTENESRRVAPAATTREIKPSGLEHAAATQRQDAQRQNAQRQNAQPAAAAEAADRTQSRQLKHGTAVQPDGSRGTDRNRAPEKAPASRESQPSTTRGESAHSSTDTRSQEPKRDPEHDRDH